MYIKEYFDYLVRDLGYMGEEMFIICMKGMGACYRWKPWSNVEKCIKVQSVGRMGKCVQNKMEMFHEEVGFIKTQIFTFFSSCNSLH